MLILIVIKNNLVIAILISLFEGIMYVYVGQYGDIS
jgi:hypothetical protein